MGHLRRIAQIAAALQGDFACLVVSGMSQTHWLVPASCGRIQLPALRHPGGSASTFDEAPLWLPDGPSGARALRRNLIDGIGKAFDPAAILVDYLPLGEDGELADLLAASHARKYLIHRGIMDSSDAGALYGDATRAIAENYDRILVTADERIVDVAREYRFTAEAAAKVRYVGYVRPLVALDPPGASHRRRIVCAFGGGIGNEQAVAACIASAARLPQHDFHIVAGPHGARLRKSAVPLPHNCHLVQVDPLLNQHHHQADVVVTHGGYNSVMEAVSGGARVLVAHIQGIDHDERVQFERRLRQYYPIRAIQRFADLTAEIALEASRCDAEPRPHFPLRLDGLPSIAAIIAEDLARSAGLATPVRASPRPRLAAQSDYGHGG